MSAPLLEVSDLHVRFPVRAGLMQRVVGHVNAVQGVSFSIARGEVFGLVGESGCGKTTTARAVLQLVEPAKGTIRYAG
ncbi:MAG: ATP-binding cassette domain-containing protein, partial [Pseudomonadota bacterium]